MFEAIIKELHSELDGKLQPGLKKCDELKGKVADKAVQEKLVAKGLELSTAIDRAALALDILTYRASIEISDDWKTVRLV